MAALDGFLYVAGGKDDQGEDVSTVERYCIANDKWEQVSSMTDKRSSLRLVGLNGSLYAIGGHHRHKKTVEKYGPQADQWEYVAPTNDTKKEFDCA